MRKKLLCLSILLLSACASPVDTSMWQDYKNEYYRFQVSFPKEYSYCLNDYCFNEIPEDAIASFQLWDEFEQSTLSIQPYKNELGMTALEFGEKAAQYNEGIHDSEAVTFAGQDAYSFTADESFFEPGGARGVTEDGHISLVYQADASEIPFVEISESSRVIYVDFEDYFYRIVYSEDVSMETVAETFEFLP